MASASSTNTAGKLPRSVTELVTTNTTHDGMRIGHAKIVQNDRARIAPRGGFPKFRGKLPQGRKGSGAFGGLVPGQIKKITSEWIQKIPALAKIPVTVDQHLKESAGLIWPIDKCPGECFATSNGEIEWEEMAEDFFVVTSPCAPPPC
jgi:hypothetical protein